MPDCLCIVVRVSFGGGARAVLFLLAAASVWILRLCWGRRLPTDSFVLRRRMRHIILLSAALPITSFVFVL